MHPGCMVIIGIQLLPHYLSKLNLKICVSLCSNLNHYSFSSLGDCKSVTVISGHFFITLQQLSIKKKSLWLRENNQMMGTISIKRTSRTLLSSCSTVLEWPGPVFRFYLPSRSTSSYLPNNIQF